uniref:motility protein A n=1 Tax=Pararhizobium sp. IMCC3301 TaxID=3067904 RepID=UPI0027425EC7|nr:MotA/TolQ/ExbB proton channel family protein [Pararhizobium sp. IMCC3301]
MDLASILGIVFSFSVVVVAMFLGGNLSQFVDLPSVLIVIGGGLAATLIRFPLAGLLAAFGTGGKVAFKHKKSDARSIIEKIAELADIVRRNGPLGLEEVELSDPTLAKGVQYVTDGYEAAFIRDAMERERDLYLERLEEGQRVFKALGDSAPAFGMIGTLVGLVQLLSNMDDPSAIGPAMATALLTTLYGALIANVICMPIADKLGSKFKTEELNQSLIIDGVMQLRQNKSPDSVKEALISYLPEHARAGFQPGEAA